MNRFHFWFFSICLICVYPLESLKSNAIIRNNNNDMESQDGKRRNRPPVFKDKWDDPNPQSVIVGASGLFILNCSVGGRPSPKLKWFKNSQEINSPNDRP